jgi:hypothetical protein
MGGARARWAATRAATVGLMLAVAVVGLRARGVFSHQGSSSLAHAGERVVTVVFGVAEGAGLVACVILLALVRRPKRRKPEDEAQEGRRPPDPWWTKTLAMLFALALLATPWVVLRAGRNRARTTQPIAPLRPLVPPAGTSHLTTPSGSGTNWPLLAGMLLGVVAVLTLALLARRRSRHGHARSPGPARRVRSLAEGLAAGRDALLAGGEPRAAIIACYAAMERGFAAAGSAPAAADSPAEVLTRAGEAGLVRSGSAEVLTGLFRRARYSSQLMTSADSAAAASALARMRADLEGADSGGGR